MNTIAHTSWGPSSSDRRILCAGSLAAEEPIPDTDNVHAVIGSGAHALADKIAGQSVDTLKTDLALSAMDYVGEDMFVEMSEDLEAPIEFNNEQVRSILACDWGKGEPKAGYLVKVDSEMAHAVDEYIQHIRAHVMHKHFTGLCGSETSFDLSEYLPGNKGTADWYALVNTTLHVDDFKYGKGVQVYATNNSQGRCYALGVYLRYGFLYDIKKVVITIHQPRLGHVDSETLTVEELLAWADTVLRPAYALSIQPDAPRIPGEKQCTFCKAKASRDAEGNIVVCQALQDELDKQMGDAFPVLPKEDMTYVQGDISPDFLPLEMAKLAAKWAKAIEALAYERLEAGQRVYDGNDYYKLVHGKGSRVWLDETKARRKCAGMRLSRDEFMTKPQFLSVAQIEKLVGKPKFKEVFTDVVEKKEGKPTIAKESDKRATVGSAEALGFEDCSTDPLSI